MLFHTGIAAPIETASQTTNIGLLAVSRMASTREAYRRKMQQRLQDNNLREVLDGMKTKAKVQQTDVEHFRCEVLCEGSTNMKAASNINEYTHTHTHTLT